MTRTIRGALAAFLMLEAGLAHALEPVTLDDAVPEVRLDRHLEYAEDPSGGWSITDVASTTSPALFTPSPGDGFNVGLTSSAYWLRVHLHNASSFARTWLVELPWPIVDRVDLYYPEAGGRLVRKSAGDTIPFPQWDVTYRSPTFAVPFEANETKTLHLRVEGQDTMLLSLFAHSPESLQEKRVNESLGFGLYYGAILGLVLYNLAQFFAMRDRDHLYYVLAMSSFAIYQLSMDGLAYQYFWPTYPWWAQRSLYAAITATALLYLLFARSFLMTRTLMPRLDRWFGFLFLASPLVFVACFFGALRVVSLAGGLIVVASGPLVVWASVVSWKQGNRPVGYVMVGWALSVFATVIYALRGYGLVASHVLTDHALQVGVIANVLTLSLALAARIDVLRAALAESVGGLEQRIRERTAELEAANRHKSAFLANMSHELRTPLNAVIGFSQVLLRKVFGALSEKQEEYLRDIHGSGRHLLSLINDILDLAKIEAGRHELELSRFDLRAAIEQAFLLVRERATLRNLRLVAELDPALGEWVADERKVKQVLINLLTNAVKFTPEGGVITVQGTLDGDRVEIAVVDTGIGIAPEDLSVIFEPFRQAGADDGKGEGTGLGLALVRNLVELHGGEVRVDSEVGRGSTFRVSLPQGCLAEATPGPVA